MSIQIADINLTGAVVGQTGTIPASGALPVMSPTLAQQMQPDSGNLPVVVVFNESPCIVRLDLPNSNQSITLPSGRWVPVTIPANETVINWTVQAVSTGTALFKALLADYYNPGEPVEQLGVLGNSPIAVGGGSVSLTTNQLTPDAGAHALIAVFDATNSRMDLEPGGTSPTSPMGQAFTYRDAGGVQRLGLNLAGDGSGGVGGTAADKVTWDASGNLSPDGAIASLGGQASTGSFGAPVIVAQVIRHAVAVTTRQVVLSFTAPVTGLYRMTAYAEINGSGGTAVSMDVSWFDPDASNGPAPATLFGWWNKQSITTTGFGLIGALNLNTVPAFVVSLPYTFMCAATNSMSVGFQDNAGTPDDHVTVIIERLA